MKTTVTQRPAETVTGLGAGLAVYGFATQVGLPQLAAGIVAVAVVVVPFVVSTVVDLVRSHQPGAASDDLLPEKAQARIEAAARKVL